LSLFTSFTNSDKSYNVQIRIIFANLSIITRDYNQWRRQDLLRGGAKLEMSWDTHGGLQGPSAADWAP